MIHERFEIDRWTKLFPLEKLRAEARAFVETRHAESPKDFDITVEDHVKLMNPGGEIVTSPFHLAVVEQLRAETLRRRCLPTAPTDVFVFANGEPQNRNVTKVGGLPFWPAEKKWPVGPSGKPMDFVAQFCFADSVDLIDQLPGDILLIFANGVYGKDWDAGDRNALRFEWVQHSQVTPIEATDVPKTEWEISPLYGEIHRTVDYLTGGVWEREWWSILLKKCKSPANFFSGLLAQRVLERSYHQPWCIAMIEGTKIGGIPRWIQNDEEMPGHFLCVLGSIHPTYQTSEDDLIPRPYPFTNVSEPLVGFRPHGEIDRDKLLTWDDVGSLYLFLGEKGAIHWTIQCY